MDDKLYVAFGAKSRNNNPTISPPIAWQGLQYLGAKLLLWPPVRVRKGGCGLAPKADVHLG